IAQPSREQSRQRAPLSLLFSGHSARGGHARVIQPRVGHQLFDEPGLPLHGLALDDHHLTTPTARPLPPGREHRQLDAATHPPRPRPLGPGPPQPPAPGPRAPALATAPARRRASSRNRSLPGSPVPRGTRRRRARPRLPTRSVRTARRTGRSRASRRPALAAPGPRRPPAARPPARAAARAE